jgi:hypothetical protein
MRIILYDNPENGWVEWSKMTFEERKTSAWNKLLGWHNMSEKELRNLFEKEFEAERNCYPFSGDHICEDENGDRVFFKHDGKCTIYKKGCLK